MEQGSSLCHWKPILRVGATLQLNYGRAVDPGLYSIKFAGGSGRLTPNDYEEYTNLRYSCIGFLFASPCLFGFIYEDRGN